jgi:replicative DNA helicase
MKGTQEKSADNSDTALLLYDERLEWNIISDLLSRMFSEQQTVWERIRPDCFFTSTTQALYRCIGYYVEKGETADVTNVAMLAMKKNICAPTDIVGKIDEFPLGYVSFIELEEHLSILEDYKMRRSLFKVSQILRKEGTQPGEDVEAVIEKVKNALTEIVDNGTTKRTVNMQDVLRALNDIVRDNLSGQETHKTTKCGFHFIDEKGGLIPTDLIIIAGNTSMGKTSFANSIVQNVINDDAKVLFFTFEMSNEQLTARILSSVTKISSQRQLYAKLSEDEVKSFDRGLTQIWECSKNLYFAGKETIDIDEICASIRKHKAKYDIKGVVIDYIQLVGGATRDENTERFLGRVARKLKNIAVSLNIWIIVLSQLNRSNDSFIPSKRFIRGSGQIEEAADTIYLIYRPEYYNANEGKNLTYPAPFRNVATEGTAMIIQDKGRNNGTGSFVCGFDAKTTHYYDFNGNVPIIQHSPQTKRENEQTKVELPF